MKKGYLLATATSAALAPLGAQAADLPAKAPMYALPVPAIDWTGWYLGVSAGAAWTQAHNDNFYINTGSTTNSTAFIGGGQIGHNWQNGNFVYGWEVDGSWLSGAAKASLPNTYAGFSAENKINWLMTARARMGLAVGNTMAYATGGLAVGGVKNTIVLDTGAFGTKSESKTRVGFAVGGGIEHMLTRNWTVGLEGMFVDLGRSTITPGGNGFYTTKFSNQAVTARMKLNYKW
jgi:outer membrane immunogenic protein